MRYIKVVIRKDVLKLNKVCEKVLSRCSYTQSMRSLKDKVRQIFHRQKQECIPVGCVPPAAVAIGGGLH